ncbi:hypothetical protein N9Y42_00320 [Mariniblastus sp.]|nr:hypothetical protein [Mariniblastus sp.]
MPTWLVIDRLALSQLSKRVRIGLPLVLVPLTYVLLIVSLFLWFTRPAAVYEMAFGFPPASDVSITSSSHSGMGDYGEHNLTFTAGRLTINDILQKKFGTCLEDSNPKGDGSYHFEREYSDIFATETSTLEYNPETQEAKYQWVGID